MSLIRSFLAGSIFGLMLAHGIAFAADQPFTGVFQGQGRGCWGKLYIRERTIEWNTPYSVCKKTSYKVIQSDLNSKPPRISFALDRKSNACRYTVIELSFDSAYPDYWQASGYQSRKDFDNRTTPTEDARLRSLSCSVQKAN